MATSFSDRQLVMGRIYGYRVFRVDALGRLTSPIMDSTNTVFMPDENTSFCHCTTDTHSSPTTDGTCGFYAYTSNRHTLPNTPQHQGIATIVSGTGDVVVGDEGFRAQHMQIQAFIMPKGTMRFRTWLEESVSRAAFNFTLCFFACMVLGIAWMPHQKVFINLAIALGELSNAVFVFTVCRYLGSYYVRSQSDENRITVLQQNYSKTLWFGSVREAFDFYNITYLSVPQKIRNVFRRSND